MIKTKQLVPNPKFDPAKPAGFGNSQFVWEFKETMLGLRVGDMVEFLCNGRGRGNHVRVFAKVTKVNQKTFKATEWAGSYAPGTSWTVNIEHALEPGNGGIIIDLSHKESK